MKQKRVRIIDCVRCGDSMKAYTSWEKRCWRCVRAADNDRLRRIARMAVKDAVLAGDLPQVKTLTCVDCGNPAQCYDHRDYYKPLDVDPVCKSCDSKRGAGYPPTINRHGERKPAGNKNHAA